MLAAGNGEDLLRIPFDRVVQGVVCSGIAGMKGNNHIHVVIRGVIGDIADLKPEGGVAVLLSGLVALLNDVRFQVQADDVHGQVPDLREIVIENEGEVGLAAAEVDDAEGLVCGIVLILIVDDFQEPVDLAELVIP